MTPFALTPTAAAIIHGKKALDPMTTPVVRIRIRALSSVASTCSKVQSALQHQPPPLGRLPTSVLALPLLPIDHPYHTTEPRPSTSAPGPGLGIAPGQGLAPGFFSPSSLPSSSSSSSSTPFYAPHTPPPPPPPSSSSASSHHPHGLEDSQVNRHSLPSHPLQLPSTHSYSYHNVNTHPPHPSSPLPFPLLSLHFPSLPSLSTPSPPSTPFLNPLPQPLISPPLSSIRSKQSSLLLLLTSPPLNLSKSLVTC